MTHVQPPQLDRLESMLLFWGLGTGHAHLMKTVYRYMFFLDSAWSHTKILMEDYNYFGCYAYIKIKVFKKPTLELQWNLHVSPIMHPPTRGQPLYKGH